MNVDPFEVLGVSRSASMPELRSARRRLAFELHPDRGGDEAAMQAVNAAFEACAALVVDARSPRRVHQDSTSRAERDAPSFTVDALPAETFEALLVVVSWIGEVLDDDPPYVLECHLADPAPCWCRLDIVPDAGGSTVSLTVVTSEGSAPVSAELVRDTWVEQLNQLGRPLP